MEYWVKWASKNLTSDQASVYLAAAGMRRSLDGMMRYKYGNDYIKNTYKNGVCVAIDYSIDEMAEAAAIHNNPNAPYNWKEIDQKYYKDFRNDVG